MGTFKEDLKIGKKYEDIILKRAKKDYPEAYTYYMIAKNIFYFRRTYFQEVVFCFESMTLSFGNIIFQ